MLVKNQDMKSSLRPIEKNITQQKKPTNRNMEKFKTRHLKNLKRLNLNDYRDLDIYLNKDLR